MTESVYVAQRSFNTGFVQSDRGQINFISSDSKTYRFPLIGVYLQYTIPVTTIRLPGGKSLIFAQRPSGVLSIRAAAGIAVKTFLDQYSNICSVATNAVSLYCVGEITSATPTGAALGLFDATSFELSGLRIENFRLTLAHDPNSPVAEDLVCPFLYMAWTNPTTPSGLMPPVSTWVPPEEVPFE